MKSNIMPAKLRCYIEQSSQCYQTKQRCSIFALCQQNSHFTPSSTPTLPPPFERARSDNQLDSICRPNQVSKRPYIFLLQVYTTVNVDTFACERKKEQT